MKDFTVNHYDKLFIGTGPISIIDACLASELGQQVLLIDEKEQLGGAWGAITVGEFGRLEIGCHIWSYNKVAYNFIQSFFNLNLIPLNPQPYFLNRQLRIPYDHKNGFAFLKKTGKHALRLNFKALANYVRTNPSARFPVFTKNYLYPKGGARELQEAIVRKIDESKADICFNTRIVEMAKTGDFWELRDARGAVFKAKAVCLTSTSSVERVRCGKKVINLTHGHINYTHYHLVIKGQLLKPCSYIRVLNNKFIHRMCDITYQLENQSDTDLTVLLVGVFDSEIQTLPEKTVLDNLFNFLYQGGFINADNTLIYAQKNNFETTYIPENQLNEISELDESLTVLRTTDLMYGIHYALPNWKMLKQL